MPAGQNHPPTTIHRIRLKASNCYLLHHEGVVIVDAGLRREGASILRAMKRLGISPSDVMLILLTHGHLDHAGGAAELAAATGAPVALHAADAAYLSEGGSVPAPVIGRWARGISRLLSTNIMQRMTSIGELYPDILLGDEDFPLHPYGVPGTVVHTPGHTAGSVCALLDDGRALVGDCAMRGFQSLHLKPGPPFFVQDLPELVESWRRLYERGATTLYPGHGSPFPAEALQWSEEK